MKKKRKEVGKKIQFDLKLKNTMRQNKSTIQKIEVAYSLTK